MVSRCLLSLRHDRVDDLLAAVAGVGDQHAARPVDPAVAVRIVNLEALGMVPDDGRLAAHGHRLDAFQNFERGNGARRRNLRHNAPVLRLYAGDPLGYEFVCFRHGILPL